MQLCLFQHGVRVVLQSLNTAVPLLLLPGRYENTERRAAAVEKKGLKYLGMGVSGGEEGARNGGWL